MKYINDPEKVIEQKKSSIYSDTASMGRLEAGLRSKQSMQLSKMFEAKADKFFAKAAQATKEGAYKYADTMFAKGLLAQEEAFRMGYQGIKQERKSK